MPGARLRCVVNDRSDDVTIESVREHKGRLLIALDEAQDATAAERFVGATFYASKESLDVGDDEYLDVDLVGCEVFSVDGKRYGVVTSVQHYPASDMLIVDGRMLPMVKAFIRTIDITTKRITVDVPPGLLDDDAELS